MMSLSRGSLNLDVLRAATYKRPNSPIFAPFMINVVCNLLNNSALIQYQDSLDVEAYIANWGGGLKKLQECYPLWDKRVSDACKIAPCGHIIWKKFVDAHKIPNRESLNPVKVLQALLTHWCDTANEQHTYGPYPTPFEQQEFQNLVVLPMGYIAEAITELTFEPCFSANQLDIRTFIGQQQQQQKQERMEEDGKDEYKANKMVNDDPFNYNANREWNYNANQKQIKWQNFDGHKEEKKQSMLDTTNNGILYYQSAYYTDEQCINISHHFMYNKQNAPKLLFGDNNVDKNRRLSENRLYFGGQAQDLGRFDRWFGYGITTTWKEKMNENSSYFQGSGSPNRNLSDGKKPDFNGFQQLMNQQFKPLIDHLANGRDIIVPAPTYQDLRENRSIYFDRTNTQKFQHNLGTGTGNLEFRYLKYIQLKLDQLNQYASRTQHISLVKMYPKKIESNQQQSRNAHRPATLSPNRYLKSSDQYRRDKNRLNLPFNGHDLSSVTNPKTNKRLNTSAAVAQRLNFDEKQNDGGSSLPQLQNDPFSSLEYKSPRRAHQRRPKNGTNRNNMFQQNHANPQNVQLEEKNDVLGRGIRSEQKQSFFDTPQRHVENGRIPHYKSPTGFVETKQQWQTLSDRRKNVNGVKLAQFSPRNDYKYRNSKDLDMFRDAINWCFFMLFFFPRRIYVALIVQNRPQDVFKISSVVFGAFALITFVVNGDLTMWCKISGVCAIICAICGGDQFYPQQGRPQRLVPRFGMKWNGRDGDGNRNHGNPYTPTPEGMQRAQSDNASAPYPFDPALLSGDNQNGGFANNEQLRPV